MYQLSPEFSRLCLALHSVRRTADHGCRPTAGLLRRDPLDHTAEFDPADISANKVFALIPYLMGWVGVIITLLASSSSPYAGFHVRQALKIQIAALLSLVLLIIPFLGWVAAFACKIIAIVLNLICFFRVCSGKAIEAPIVSSFKFLK